MALTHVIYADDDDGNYRLGRMNLQYDFPGVFVERATTGLELVESVRKREYDLVITDGRMPVMDGVEAIRALRHFYEGPIVMFSGSPEMRDDALAAGANAFYLKPNFPGKDELEKLLKP